MKLGNLHQASPLEAALLSNVAVKSMLQPLVGRTYWWKDFDKFEKQPPPPSKGGVYSGGHYDALIKGNPRLDKYFGGPSLGPM